MPVEPSEAPEGLDDIVEDKNLADHLSLDSRPASRQGTPKPPPAINPVLASILQQDREKSPVGVEEVSSDFKCSYSILLNSSCLLQGNGQNEIHVLVYCFQGVALKMYYYFISDL